MNILQSAYNVKFNFGLINQYSFWLDNANNPAVNNMIKTNLFYSGFACHLLIQRHQSKKVNSKNLTPYSSSGR